MPEYQNRYNTCFTLHPRPQIITLQGTMSFKIISQTNNKLWKSVDNRALILSRQCSQIAVMNFKVSRLPP